MKTLQFGWEVDGINNNAAQFAVPILQPITVRALQLDCAYMVITPPTGFTIGGLKIGTPPNFAEVLCSVGIFPQAPSNEFAVAGTFSGTAIAHGGLGAGHLAVVILKTWVSSAAEASATSRDVYVSGLNLSVGPGQNLQANMGHMGFPGDVEMQGVLFYD